MTALLSASYFGPVQWYQKLYRYPSVLIEQYDSYQKQTYRNRCLIATSNGVQALTVPVERPAGGFHSVAFKDVRVSDHGNWRHLHREALRSAYSDSPFFLFYADDILPLFDLHSHFLIDYDMEICRVVCRLIDISPCVSLTSHYMPACPADFRDVISPKHPLPDDDFSPAPYYQVFSQRIGFQPNLSILDLLFNMGPEAVFYL